MNEIVPIIQIALTMIISIAVPLLSSLFQTVSSVFGSILATVSGVMNGILSIVSGIWGVISGVFQTVVGFIVGVVTGDFSMMSDGVSSILGGLASIASGAWDAVSSVISGAIEVIVSVVEGGLNSASAIVQGVFDGIGSVIGDTMSTAQSTVSGALDAISGFFAGLHLEFPHINLPHFSLSGEFSLMPPSVPTISVEWYAQGGIMTAPTLFGMNGGRAMVGGEAGPEAVLPIERLQGFVDAAFDNSNAVTRDELSDIVKTVAENSGQVVNFYQPIKTPSQVTRELRLQRTYGLAGAR